MPVLRDDEARRAQAVAVERARGIAAVGEHDAGRAVPRLHVRRVVLVERAQVRIDRVERRARPAAPAGASHAADRGRPSAAPRACCRGSASRSPSSTPAAGRPTGPAAAASGTRGPRASAQLRLPCDRVDLAVVREIAERMREPPLRQRVGGEALVEHRHRRLQARVAAGPGRTRSGAAASPCP